MPGIAADLHRAIVESHICVRHAVIFIYPIRIQRDIRSEYVLVPLQLFCTFDIEIPTVKNSIQAFGLGQVLQRMITYKYLLDIFKFVRKHIECDRSPLFADERVYVYGTVPEIPVVAQATQIIRGGIQHLPHFGNFGISVLRKIQGD